MEFVNLSLFKERKIAFLMLYLEMVGVNHLELHLSL